MCCVITTFVIIFVIVAITMFCIRKPSGNKNSNNNTAQAKVNVSSSSEIDEQNDESSHLETSVGEVVNTNKTNELQNNNTNENEVKSKIEAIIKPEIHNEIKLYIDDAHQETKEDIGKDVSREMQNVHNKVKEEVENGIQNITKQVMEYTAIIFAMAAFGVLVYVMVRAHMDKIQRQNAEAMNSVRMTDCQQSSDAQDQDIENGGRNNFLPAGTKTTHTED